ncbi:Guanylate-binding protein 4 [Sciurus carolinensis]|uniref:Guanylate-binding protein 4 n=1 Tax=Sciurus carolinensis TaxID=30640 RepID=A0AA41NJN3_SCICA|nr:Guanylate-binding protein 4 [Sciurus carolinensis]
MLEEMGNKYEKMVEKKDKSYQEGVKQLTEKMEQDRAQLKAQQEQILALKLQLWVLCALHQQAKPHLLSTEDLSTVEQDGALEDAVTTLAQHENSAAVQKAADHYSEQMAQRVEFPTDTLQELLEVHTACEREAIAVFMEHSFKDDKLEFQKELVIIHLSYILLYPVLLE